MQFINRSATDAFLHEKSVFAEAKGKLCCDFSCNVIKNIQRYSIIFEETFLGVFFYFSAIKLLKSTSVADPDPFGSGDLGHPDPGKYRIRIFYPQKDPM